jgi:hypothetical protein
MAMRANVEKVLQITYLIDAYLRAALLADGRFVPGLRILACFAVATHLDKPEIRMIAGGKPPASRTSTTSRGTTDRSFAEQARGERTGEYFLSTPLRASEKQGMRQAVR